MNIFQSWINRRYYLMKIWFLLTEIVKSIINILKTSLISAVGYLFVYYIMYLKAKHINNTICSYFNPILLRIKLTIYIFIFVDCFNSQFWAIVVGQFGNYSIIRIIKQVSFNFTWAEFHDWRNNWMLSDIIDLSIDKRNVNNTYKLCH